LNTRDGFKIRLNIIILSPSRSHKWPFSKGFPTKAMYSFLTTSILTLPW